MPTRFRFRDLPALHLALHTVALAVATLVFVVATVRNARAEGDGLELLFVGDVSFAGRPAPGTAARACGVANPLAAFAERFAAADLVIANVEGLLTATRPPAYGESRLDIGASPLWAGVFAAAHVSAVGLANNHSWDAGAAGVLEQRANLAATGVGVFGVGADAAEAEAPWLFERDGACVAVVPATLKSNRRPDGVGAGAAVAFYAGAAGLERLASRIKDLRDRGCFVIVSVHWGREGVHRPPRAVIHAAHRLVDAGAGLVVGHHPHVLQGVEWRGEAAIAYSLGNFVFTNRSPDKRETGVLAVRLTRERPPRLLELALIPAVISLPDFTPRPATARQRATLRAHLAGYGAIFAGHVNIVDERIVFSPPDPP